MKEEYYTLKEVILGLRGEYLKLSNNMNKLENLVIYDKNKVRRAHFFLDKRRVNEVGLYCDIKHRRKRLIDIIRRNINNKSFKIEDFEKFKEIMHKLYDDEFVKSIVCEDDKRFQTNDVEEMYYTDYSKLGFYNMNHNYKYANVVYNAISDTLKIYKLNDDIFGYCVSDTLGLEIPKSIFSDVQKDIIEKSESAKKEVALKDMLYDRVELKLKIKEYDNVVYLEKVKRKKYVR